LTARDVEQLDIDNHCYPNPSAQNMSDSDPFQATGDHSSAEDEHYQHSPEEALRLLQTEGARAQPNVKDKKDQLSTVEIEWQQVVEFGDKLWKAMYRAPTDPKLNIARREVALLPADMVSYLHNLPGLTGTRTDNFGRKTGSLVLDRPWWTQPSG
jgi:hypothetical protein